ncbi:MAG: hypothetical protein H8D97_01140 [Proteobacteria bacterium]|nr:hypothetical protein [Pseudomonadota bacterium]
MNIPTGLKAAAAATIKHQEKLQSVGKNPFFLVPLAVTGVACCIAYLRTGSLNPIRAFTGVIE